MPGTAVVAHTPYHVTLALQAVQALGKEALPVQVHMVADVPEAKRFAAPFDADAHDPGSERVHVHLHPGTWGKGLVASHIVSGRTARAIVRSLERQDPARVLVSHDERVEGQAAIRWALRRGRRIEWSEDGTAAYLPPKTLGGAPEYAGERFGKPGMMARRLLSMSRWTPVGNLGAFGGHGTYKAAWLTHPDLALPQVAPGSPRIALPPLGHRQDIADRMETWLRDVGIDSEAVRQSRVLALPDHPLHHGARAGAFWHDALQHLGPCLVKRHPRDPNTAPAGEGILLPSAMPAEWVVSYLGASPVIIGTTSSALLSSRWARPDCTSMSLAALPGAMASPLPEAVRTLFNAAGIHTPASWDDVDARLPPRRGA